MNKDLVINKSYLESCLLKICFFPLKPKIAIASSGGSDSMGLLLLFQELVLDPKSRFYKSELIALIIDHNLRSESYAEAMKAQQIIENKGVKAKVLRVVKQENHTRIQSNARSARYKSLLKYCNNNKIFYLFVAHHSNDLIETISMRTKRGPNIFGNAGISMKSYANHFDNKGVIVIRPLLGVTKASIRSYLTKCKVEWIEDPSNQKLNFERVKVRQELNCINSNFDLGTVYDYSINRLSLEKEFLQFVINYVHISKMGEVRIKIEPFVMANQRIQLVIMRAILKFVSNKDYMPKIAKVTNIITHLKKAHDACKDFKQSLAKCLVVIKGRNIVVIKEPKRIVDINFLSDLDKKREFLIWDKRFKINLNLNIKDSSKAKISCLNSLQYDELVSKVDNARQKFHEIGLYKDLIMTLPWLFIENKAVLYWLDQLADLEKVSFWPEREVFSEFFCGVDLIKGLCVD